MSEKFDGKIKVTVEKSHLLTLGERMYVESIELIRELVNNAYDADAIRVYVTVGPKSIVVEDNGSGMNKKGLTQFFAVGSEEKKKHGVSPRFGRKRIGQFGIGKFAALSAADRFTVRSRKAEWVYTVTFDREAWQKETGWELPITRNIATPLDTEGTRVTLSKLKRKFKLSDVERYLKEAVPIRAKKFDVFLNGKQITAGYIPGRRIHVSFKTIYGPIEGEIVIAADPKMVRIPGIECRVKQVLIKRELFGFEAKPGTNRITGEVNADFLPITAARNDFIRDEPSYRLFHQLIRNELEKVLIQFKKEKESRELKRISRELRQVLDKIRNALKLNPYLTPSGRAVARLRRRKDTLSASTVREPTIKEVKKEALLAREAEISKKEKEEEKPARPKVEPRVIRRIRIKKLGISVGIASLGEDSPESTSYGNLVYINQDYPLYKRFYSKKDAFELYLLRLITKEIVLMKKLRLEARQAYLWQSKLLTDALISSKK